MGGWEGRLCLCRHSSLYHELVVVVAPLLELQLPTAGMVLGGNGEEGGREGGWGGSVCMYLCVRMVMIKRQ